VVWPDGSHAEEAPRSAQGQVPAATAGWLSISADIILAICSLTDCGIILRVVADLYAPQCGQPIEDSAP
jgi:hypothetical protein